MDIAALKQAALAASTESGQFANGTTLTSEFLAFVDEANPAAVLALIESHERLTAENEALRKDAERYRYLRDYSGSGECLHLMRGSMTFDSDSYIDAALAAAGAA